MSLSEPLPFTQEEVPSQELSPISSWPEHGFRLMQENIVNPVLQLSSLSSRGRRGRGIADPQ